MGKNILLKILENSSSVFERSKGVAVFVFRISRLDLGTRFVRLDFALKYSWKTFDKTNKRECRSEQGEDSI